MYMVSSSSFFLGASTPAGFHSLFSELHSPEDGQTLYILKGGPGTGKSTFMKKIAAECEKRGHYYERIHCSSDPKSLDAVIIPSLKVSIADGTAPHVLEPKYPGISEKLIDLGVFRDDGILNKNRDRVIELTDENKEQHKSCTAFLSAAKSAANDNTAVALSALRIARVHKFAEKLAEAKLIAGSDKRTVLKKRFLSALTPEGLVIFRDSFSGLCENKVILQDSFGCAASVIIKILALRAQELGIGGIISYCPLSPEMKPEHLIFPELSLGFYTANRHHPDDFGKVLNIDCKRLYDTDILSRHKNRIAFNNRSKDELITAAINKLAAAKHIHDELEKYYIEATDFNKMSEHTEKLIDKILS